MRNNIRKIYRLRVYLQVQKIVYLILLMGYVKVLKEALEPDCKLSESENCLTEKGLPKAYNAIRADIDLFEIDENKKESWMGFLLGDKTQGEGKSLLVTGSWFDINKKYYAQAVLNRGTDAEVRGDKKELIIAEIKVLDGEDEEVEELKFSDGSKDKKRYHIELIYSGLDDNACEGINGEIKIVTEKGFLIPVPGEPDEYPYSNASISFEQSGSNKCISKVKNSGTGDIREDFILTNRSNNSLGDALDIVVPMYAGIGNEFEVEILGANIRLPIEPIGVIVIGIDGLRQDVLYPPELDKVQDGGQYRVNIGDLSGLKQVLAGYDKPEEGQQYIMLPEVTAIFPSITLASWASIFTGRMPSVPMLNEFAEIIGNEGTGIVGNEFFARDIYLNLEGSEKVPGMANHGLPEGMITLSDGAFQNSSLDFIVKNLLPAHDYYPTVIEKEENSAPVTALNPDAQTIYEWIRDEKSIAQKMSLYYESTKRENITNPYGPTYCNPYRSAVFFNHYGRGADWWGTVDLEWWKELGIDIDVAENIKDIYGALSPVAASETLDKTPTKEALDYFKEYFSEDCGMRFPALFVLYYGGLDHYAHDFGLDENAGIYTGYSDFFRRFTDVKINEVISKIKELDEFDNKIFVITADHGHTAMPTNLTYKDPKLFGLPREADMSCELNIENFDKRTTKNKEKYNNNLHIWELGEVFTNFAPTVAGIKLLAPAELNNTGLNITQNPDEANVIAAMNGPMAHVYIKGTDWKSNPDEKRLGVVLDTLIRVLTLGENASDKVKKEFSRLYTSVDKILVRRTLNGTYEIVTGVAEDAVGNVIINTDSLEALNNADYINAVTRITGMNHKDRSGDIVLIMKDATSGNATNRYTTGSACKSWHGSLNPSDSYVPFILSYPGGNKYEIDKILEKDDLCKSDYSECKGNWKLTDIVKEIIKKQYETQ